MGGWLPRRKAHTHKLQKSMPWMEFEYTIPASERAKKMHALDRSATVTGPRRITHPKFRGTMKHVT
jgi:hypothetical protein